jgi:hypothetical protein
MPQVATTVTPCVKVEELRVVEVCFGYHEYYALNKLIAVITFDDNHLTQRWVVKINEEEIFRAATPMLCHRFICINYKRSTLPVQQEEEKGATTGNEVMVEIAAQCDKFGFELLDDGIYKDERKLGSVGCSDGRWWVKRASSVHQQKVLCDCAFDAVWVLSMVEQMQSDCEELLDKPFDALTASDWERLREYQPVAESQELPVAA